MSSVDLVAEMEAARKRRDENTQRLLREARVRAIQAAVRPGSSREEVEERARSFYPRLSEDLIMEAVNLVCANPRDAAKLEQQQQQQQQSG